MGKMDKDKPKPTAGEKLIEDINQRKKEIEKEKKENKEMNNTWKTIITVTVTLVVVAAFAVTFFYGSQFGASTEKAKYESIKSEAKSLSLVTESKK